MATLEQEMSSADIRCLQESNLQIRRFLAVARRIGFFVRSPDSDHVGYDVATHALLPEAPLASLVQADQSTDEPAVLAEQWNSRAQSNPQLFMQSLIDQSDQLGERYSSRTGMVGSLGVDFAKNKLGERMNLSKGVADLQSILVHCAPPDEELPAWFQVMRRYQLMPSDIEEILDWKLEIPQGDDPDIISISRTAKSGVRDVA
ncbi:hypothetical protein A3C37_01595 [Candidatus Peribacteria bacterium RIFCSPHIGHO2_02_FULL_53_20]|nr:MAG: hypothetical protein A3C37_01595 [Candidatus Peribacteria bacterium RIFCSPHIGHO2_02_FULL_53_20]OGJ67143.1 MAG: hypothetical protein A3B61_02825 [Candidatus Peribacteria bacterium RIFCSPLOWO2_01_FULL_53_10]OGJ75044.1 MAG: hypothetical protein A3G69_02075 [Candidatus Peribacteria bacterium RIFCSPLOWO2_12_FULL_53_10]HLC67245.1 hypothetical protein [Candidatus Nanoarchaeia archaeon]